MTSEPTGFLYPFIDAEEDDVEVVLADLERSARVKEADSVRTTRRALADHRDELAVAGRAMAERFARGGRLFTFGNGGSATDAAAVAALFADPPDGTPVPATCLAAEPAVITALANDVGFDLVFSRQLIAHARADDMALGMSTSGDSASVVHALTEAQRRDLLTVGLAGYQGGRMAGAGLHHCLIVRSDSVHRIQEAQTRLAWELWRVVQEELARALRPAP